MLREPANSKVIKTNGGVLSQRTPPLTDPRSPHEFRKRIVSETLYFLLQRICFITEGLAHLGPVG
jgi:hypothetical protein